MDDGPEVTDQLCDATALLEAVGADRSLLDGLDAEERIRFLNAAANAFEPDADARRQQTKARRRRERAARVGRDEAVLDDTGIRRLRARPVFLTPDVYAPEHDSATVADEDEARAGAHLGEERHCYVCKRHFTEVHHFYDQLCPPCAALSYAKRTETADLTGRVALLTGGRVKIGFQAGMKLLRAGATLVVSDNTE